MVNTEIRQFRDMLIAMTNASPLPIEVKRLIFSEVKMQIDLETEKILQMEKEEMKKEEENANE